MIHSGRLSITRLVLLFVLGWMGAAHAQLDVALQLGRRQFMQYEAVPVAVNLTNRAGQELFLHGDGRRPWLNFVVTDQRGTQLTPHGGSNFQAAKVPVGRSVARTVDLISMFSLTQRGNYSVYAIVTMPTGESFRTARVSFSVAPGRLIYQQRVGLGAKAREYRLLTFAPGQTAYIYFQAEMVDRKQIVLTYPLGELLPFRKPEATVDKEGKLHILYLATPNRFMHTLIDARGRVAERTLYGRGAVGEPRLVGFANGEVKVAGGVEYDPKAEQERNDKIRKISERPSVLFD
ncbi:MAG: hypothetical protein Q7Q71_13295 [Verrucomicrobiota bacterium JB023]|nr:hypothetical protein [Verrucomicrobiota bacterium JB023]